MKVFNNIICICLILSFFGYQKTFAQCGSSIITASYSSKCLPALVRFIVSPALAKGSIYYWDFGNGQVLGSDTSYNQYTAGGSYGVTVMVIRPDGSHCTITEPNGFVFFNPLPNPGFYADQTKVCSSPAIISLHDTTKNIVSRDWYVNGVLNSNHSANIIDTDMVKGYSSVTLIVYNNSGCTENIVKQNYIDVLPGIPLCFCSVLTENLAHTQISAKFKATFDTTGLGIIGYNWSFPSGNPSSFSGFSPPSVTYTDLSSFYNVSLTVKTNAGCVLTFTKINLIGKYYSIPKSTICAKDTGIINYVGDIGNFKGNNFFSIQSDIPAKISYIGYNQFQVKFFGAGVADFRFPINYGPGLNCYDTLVVPGLFTVLPPSAAFNITPIALCSAPGKINLHVLGQIPSSGTYSYIWQIFDSAMNQLPGSPIGPISAIDTSFVFNQDGVYSIKLIAANSDGCADTVLETNILRVGSPDINYTITPDTLCVGDTLFVNNLAKIHDAPNNPIYYDWIIGLRDTFTYLQEYRTRSFKAVLKYPGFYDLYYTIGSAPCSLSQTRYDAFLVNGITASINLHGLPSCAPSRYTIEANVSRNYPNAPLSYSWSVSPAANASIIKPNNSSPDIIFNKQGHYSVTLAISNGTCSSIITNDTIIIGTQAAFNLDSFSCRNQQLFPVNTSSKNANVYKWSITPNKGFIISNDTARNPFINFTNPGCYRVLLQTSDSSIPNCYDTVSQAICIYMPPVVKNMYSPDSSSHCAPRVDSFYVESLYGKIFFWDFGDGSVLTSRDSIVSHPYFTNSNTGFSVKVVAIDSNGCASDTFVLKNYIRISGPEPSFSVSSKPPCDSGTVYFINNSKFIYNYYFVYGDNSGVDSNAIKPHFYRYEDYSKDSNTYQPTLFAYDETGCLAFTSGIVKLYRPAIVSIAAIDTVGCMPFGVQFYDSTKYASKYLWNFGEGGTDTGFAPFHIFNQSSPAGNPFRVTLIATTDKGCADTSEPIYIDVHPLSIPTFKIIAPAILCYGDTVQFESFTKGPTPVRYKWKFGDGKLVSDTSSLQNPMYHYIYSGRHTVTLKVFTNFDCSDSISDSTTINSLDSFPPVPPKIEYITVTPSNQVEVVYSKINSSKFSSYIIYRFPGPDSIYSTPNASDTIYFDNPPKINVDSLSYTYTIRSTDICGFTSRYSALQHSILLKVNKYKLNATQLVWNKYIGWDSLKDYQVYRKDSSGTFVLLATVGAIDSTYIDSNLCPGLYTYYVKAIDENGKFYSASDTISSQPDFLYQSTPLVLIKATVVNNNYIGINWAPTIQVNFKSYSIDRYSPLDGWLYNYSTTTGLYFLDHGVDVNKYSYTYRVSVLDKCGDISPPSNIGTSIFLTGAIFNDSRLLTWNSYRQWARGVSSYHLQIIQNDGSFKDMVVLPSADSSYFDSSSHADLNIPTCYRVYAVENADVNGITDTSLSNIACLDLPARIFIPNAFTPNSDSLNDVFIPEGLSVIINSEIPGQKYDFRIYNRWGELVFETSDFRQGWNGKYEGALVPPGVYIYSVDAQGYDGHRFYLSGDVTVIR